MGKKSAFTLIELVVVIAIIAILLAVFIPSLRLARERGQRAVCLSNLRQLTIAWTLYADDNDGKLVWAASGTTEQSGLVGWVGPAFAFSNNRSEVLQNPEKGPLWPYIQDIDIYRCPSGRAGSVVTYEIVSAANGSDLNGTGCDYQTYMHKMRSSDIGNSVGSTVLRLNWLTDIRTPPMGQRAIFVDQGYRVHFYHVPYLQPHWDRLHPPPIHHAEGVTLSMADGHAEYWKWKAPETVRIPRTVLSVDVDSGSTVEFLTANYKPQTNDGMQDLQRMQKAVWGRLGYSNEEAP